MRLGSLPSPQDPNPSEPTQNPQPPGTPGRNDQKRTKEKGETGRVGGRDGIYVIRWQRINVLIRIRYHQTYHHVVKYTRIKRIKPLRPW